MKRCLHIVADTKTNIWRCYLVCVVSLAFSSGRVQQHVDVKMISMSLRAQKPPGGCPHTWCLQTRDGLVLCQDICIISYREARKNFTVVCTEGTQAYAHSLQDVAATDVTCSSSCHISRGIIAQAICSGTPPLLFIGPVRLQTLLHKIGWLACLTH